MKISYHVIKLLIAQKNCAMMENQKMRKMFSDDSLSICIDCLFSINKMFNLSKNSECFLFSMSAHFLQDNLSQLRIIKTE